jgi:hypothetical protein
MAISPLTLYIRNVRLDDIGIPLPEHLALSGRGYARFREDSGLYSTMSLSAPVGCDYSPILPRPGLFVLLIIPLGLLVLEPVLVLLAVGHGGTFEGLGCF